MADSPQMTGSRQWASTIVVALLATAALYYFVYRPQQQLILKGQQKLRNQLQETAELESYRSRLADLEQQLSGINQQLEAARRVVPEEEQADDFLRMVNAEASRAGVEIRRYTAKPLNEKDLYTEVPFEIELDGPYFSLVTFFDGLSRLERIVSVSKLLMASSKKPAEAKPRHTYQYGPQETVVATCVLTTYFRSTRVSVAPATPASVGKAKARKS